MRRLSVTRSLAIAGIVLGSGHLDKSTPLVRAVQLLGKPKLHGEHHDLAQGRLKTVDPCALLGGAEVLDAEPPNDLEPLAS